MFYNDAAPWPLPPDGEGPTLELRKPFTDLNKGQSWAASCDHGTPGRFNSPCATSGSPEVQAAEIFRMMPNPNRGVFVVECPSVNASGFQWHIYQTDGKIIRSGTIPAGQLQQTINISDAPDGIYVLEIRSENGVYQNRIIKN